jgi:molybdenum cofactor biosynthesis protein B
MSGDPHHGDAPAAESAVLTVSDTRGPDDDPSGDAIAERLTAAGHRVAARRWCADEPEQIEAALRALTDETGAAIVCVTGGTGLARRDTTVEVVRAAIDREIEGFGELFRMLSWQQIGAAAMLSRATAGVRGTSAIFALPGSRKAVVLAMDHLIAPQIGHVVGLVRPGPDSRP